MHIPSEQRFLFCMAFRVYEVIRVACLLRSWFRRHANDVVNTKSHARETFASREQSIYSSWNV